ncbi:MAG: PQQ-like beta-propeller repeat protein [Planctomycetota bacterium]|jgi:outer membrane protein assembly factor BamB
MTEPQTEEARPRALARAARSVAVVACVFSLLVCALVIINHMRVKAADPLNSAALASLLEQLEENPGDAALVENVRTLDLLARKAYFTSQRFAVTGAYLLVAGIAVMLAALAVERLVERRPPDVTLLAAAEDLETWRSPARWLVGSVGLAVTATAVVLYLAGGLPGYPHGADVAEAPVEADSPQPPEYGSPTAEEIAANWPSFRGPFGRGSAAVDTAPTDWDGPTGRNVLWKTPVPKPGFNSPVVWGNRVFLTGADADAREVYCFDADTGALLWTHKVTGIPGSPPEAPEVTEETGYAAPTAATDGRRVFAMFANGDLVAVDFDGARRLAVNLGIPGNPYGHASSLITADGMLFVQFDHDAGGYLHIFDCETGLPVRTITRNVETSWASPVLAPIAGKDCILLSASPFVEAYETATGRLSLRVDCLSGEIGSSPAFGDGLVFAGNQFAILSGIDPVSEEILWQTYEDLPDASSPLAKDGLLYVATSEGVITCYEAATGEVRWKEEFDEGFYSSPVHAAGNVYVIDMAGVARIFKAAGEYQPVGSPALGEESASIPAFAEGRIYIRGFENLYCIGSPND